MLSNGDNGVVQGRNDDDSDSGNENDNDDDNDDGDGTNTNNDLGDDDSKGAVYESKKSWSKLIQTNLKLCFNQLPGVWNTRNLSGIFHVEVLTIFGGAKNSGIVLITFICTSIIIIVIIVIFIFSNIVITRISESQGLLNNIHGA